MKKYLMLMTLGFLLTIPMKANAEGGWNAGFDVFYSSLSPYGEWVQADFGYAWRPLHVAYGWRPYLYGRWVWTDYGWYWVSAEPFGWATFHYGRWYYDDFYGWIWLPGEVWGPAWVEWRYNDDYVGWAPLPPYAEFSANVGVTFTNRWVAPVHYWNFVAVRHFTSTRIVEHVQPVEHAQRFFGSTRGSVAIRTEGERVVNRGIDVNFVQQRGNVRINRVDVVAHERGTGERFVRDADRERVEVYRPRLDQRENNNTLRENPSGRIENRRQPMAPQIERPSERSKGIDRGFGQGRMREPQPWPPSRQELKQNQPRQENRGMFQRPPNQRNDGHGNQQRGRRSGERKP